MNKRDQWSRVCDLLFAIHKEDILRDGDWWYGTDNHDINFFRWDDQPDDYLHVVVYDMTDQYSTQSVVFSKHIHTGEQHA